jgi:hypothetical protein
VSPTGGYASAPDPAEEAVRSHLATTSQLPIGARLGGLIDDGFLRLPRPGSGASWARFRRLAEIAADDLSLARLAEGHADSLAILQEAGLDTDGDLAVHGVWVAGPPLEIVGEGDSVLLSGERDYCSGAGIVERALVTASRAGDIGPSLFEIDATVSAVKERPGSWPSVGMAATHSVSLDMEQVPALQEVGHPGFYEERLGFWLGSLNVAACWYGGALGLVRHVHGMASTADRSIAGQLDSAIFEMRLMLTNAAREIDVCPFADRERAELLALRVRDHIYRQCQVVLVLAAELGGTHSAARDAAQSRRLADLPVYLRQYRPARDRARMGELLESSSQRAVCHE